MKGAVEVEVGQEWVTRTTRGDVEHLQSTGALVLLLSMPVSVKLALVPHFAISYQFLQFIPTSFRQGWQVN